MSLCEYFHKINFHHFTYPFTVPLCTPSALANGSDPAPLLQSASALTGWLMPIQSWLLKSFTITLIVLVSYCCVTNYAKTSGLKQQTYYLRISVNQEAKHDLAGSSLAQSLSQAALKVFARVTVTSMIDEGEIHFQEFSCDCGKTPFPPQFLPCESSQHCK